MHRHDARLAELVRLIRRQAHHTQLQLAVLARVPLNDLKKIEAGDAGAVKLSRARDVLEAEGARGRLVPWWNGAAADRLLDSRHAALVERVVALLMRRGWDVHVEISFSEWGERGSIDILALRRAEGVAIAIEVKSAIGSLEETNRALDAKVRLAPVVVKDRFGWRPRAVARLLVVPNTSSVRRIIAAHAATMDVVYPARSREVRAWLRRPESALSGIWFVSDGPHSSSVDR